ncbi:hypothetical protein M0R45_001562 [Rubus argutus]|uniref:Uncharacterized protein n=1 Tax=Rubus argutus TaxID=59490 RepID=A0AAW1VLD6_RUBAR
MVSDIDPWKPKTEIQDEEIPHYGGSNGVVIEELSDEPRKKSSVVIKELPDEPLKIARARTKKKEIGIVIRDLDGKDDTLTQASNAPVHDPKDKGKQKVGVEQTTDSKLCEYFDNMLFDIKVSDLQPSVTRGRHEQPYEQESEDSGNVLKNAPEACLKA